MLSSQISDFKNMQFNQKSPGDTISEPNNKGFIDSDEANNLDYTYMLKFTAYK